MKLRSFAIASRSMQWTATHNATKYKQQQFEKRWIKKQRWFWDVFVREEEDKVSPTKKESSLMFMSLTEVVLSFHNSLCLLVQEEENRWEIIVRNTAAYSSEHDGEFRASWFECCRRMLIWERERERGGGRGEENRRKVDRGESKELRICYNHGKKKTRTKSNKTQLGTAKHCPTPNRRFRYLSWVSHSHIVTKNHRIRIQQWQVSTSNAPGDWTVLSDLHP